MTTFCDLIHNKYIITTSTFHMLYHNEITYVSNTNDMLQRILYSVFINELKTNPTRCTEVKYEYVKNILTNPFYIKEHKMDFISKFQHIQRLYRVLSNFAYKYKWKRAKYAIKHDLLMNELSPDQYFVLPLLHNGKKYLFTKSDLTNIIETALTNSPYIYAEPLPVKNPYNNLIFGKSHLYTIYFFMKQGGFIFSRIFHEYFMCNFNLKYFRDNNETMIRKIYINKMVNTNDTTKLKADIKIMLRRYNSNQKNPNMVITVNPDFPSNILIDAMRPYLHLYYTFLHSLSIVEKNMATQELVFRLRKFKTKYPSFGRKCIKLSQSIMRTKPFGETIYHSSYDKLVIQPFHKNFHTSHTEIIEDEYDEEKENTPSFSNIGFSIGSIIGTRNQTPILSTEDDEDDEDDDTLFNDDTEDEDVNDDVDGVSESDIENTTTSTINMSIDSPVIGDNHTSATGDVLFDFQTGRLSNDENNA